MLPQFIVHLDSLVFLAAVSIRGTWQEGSDGFKNGCEINDRCETVASDVHCSTLYEIEVSKQSVV